MRWLAERAYGFIVGAVRVPIVPAAVLFDFWLGDASIRPDASAGYAACENASDQAPEEGSVGAGAGAVVGKMFGMERAMRGGIGSAAAKIDGVTVGALVAVNSGGDVVDAHTDQVIAGARTPDGTRLLNSTAALMRGEKPAPPKMGSNTTIGIVATDALLTKVQATRIATMAHDGLARSINPVHTLLDGDTMFALGTGTSGREISATLLGTVAAEVTAAAVLRAVRAAQGLPEFPAARDLSGSI
jgi:L-aminopeptidase/D-esterase-like protein